MPQSESLLLAHRLPVVSIIPSWVTQLGSWAWLLGWTTWLGYLDGLLGLDLRLVGWRRTIGTGLVLDQRGVRCPRWLSFPMTFLDYMVNWVDGRRRQALLVKRHQLPEVKQ